MIGNLPGVGPESLEGNPTSGYRVAYPFEVFSTPLLDITQPLSAMELIPARLGHVPIAATGTWSIESVVGVQTVPAQVQAGNDASHTNIFASTASPSNATVNTTTPPSISNGINKPLRTQIFPNSTVFFDITAGAQGTGGFKCMAKLVVAVLWASIGG